MLTRAQVKHDLLEDDLPSFTTKFPNITATWRTSFETDITTALNFQSDAAVVNIIKVLTEDLESTVDEGADALDTLDIYARVAYPNSPAKQRVFGQDKWEKARNDQQKMSKALKLAHSFANAEPYKTALLAAGITSPAIDSLLTIAGNIDTKDGLQEKAKAGRPVTTEDRIELLNIVWYRQRELAIAAELVYKNDPAKHGQYLLYPPGTSLLTTVRVVVLRGGLAQAGATVLLSNTALVAQTTNAEGVAVFTSVQMPESLDITVTLADNTVLLLDNQPIIEGEENVIEAIVPV